MRRLKSISFFSWLYQNITEQMAAGISKTLSQLGAGSVLQRYKQWASKPKVQLAVWILLVIGLIGYMGSLMTSIIPATFTMVHEVLVYFCFFTIVIHKREWGITIFAFYLPLLTYRPLLVLLLIMLLLLCVDGVSKARLRDVFRNRMNLSIGIFMAVLLLSSIASTGWKAALIDYGLYYFASLILYFLVLFHIDSARVLKLAMLGLVVGGVLISLYAAYQYMTIGFTSQKWVDIVSNPLLTKRAAATFGNPNIFGQYLVLIAPLAFVLMWFKQSWRYRIYLGGVFLCIALALVLTFSRGSWLALGVAGVLLAIMINRRLVILGIIAAAIGVNFLPDVIMDRILSIFNTQDTSSVYRFEAWQSAFSMIRDFWLTGIGMDEQTFLNVYPNYMLNDVRVFHFHNIFLMHFVTGGILGFLAVLFLFYQSFRSLVTSMFTFSNAPFLNGVAKGLFASILAIMIAALTEDVWRHYAVLFTFWFVFALVGALSQLNKTEVQIDGQ